MKLRELVERWRASQKAIDNCQRGFTSGDMGACANELLAALDAEQQRWAEVLEKHHLCIHEDWGSCTCGAKFDEYDYFKLVKLWAAHVAAVLAGRES